MKTVKAAVIGIGNMGSAHVNCIGGGRIKGLELVAACDLAPERLDYLKKNFPNVTPYSNWEDVVAREDLDAIVVAVPHPLHGKIAMAAMKAGKHVLVEKPVDVSVTVAKQMNETARETGKIFGIMFNQRTNPLFAKAKEMIANGELGDLKRSVWIITNWYRTQHYYDSGSWRATWTGEGGGVLLNQAPHNLDLWQWICGMPCEITGFCDIAKYHRIEVEDDVTIFARYPNGATGAFITSTGEYPGTNRLEISGTLGKIVLENGVMKWWKLKENERDVCVNSNENSGHIEMEYQEIVQDEPETAHAGILQNFTNAILNGTPLLSPGVEGINELSISNATYLSAWKGSVPVKLPLDGAEFDALLEQHRQDSQLKSAAVSEKYNTEYQARWQINW